MADPKPLDQEYSVLMQKYPFGKALYKPPSSSRLHPGGVGYFDSRGDWNPITDLSALSSSPAQDPVFSPFPREKLRSAPTESQVWGPKVGTQTRGRKIDIQESVSLSTMTAVPVNLGSCFRFETNESAGSVLLVEGPVLHRRYYHEEPFKQWVAANAKTIFAERPEVKDYGLWVVTSTWTANTAAINCWSQRDKAVDVGFNIKLVEIGEIAPKGGWYHTGEADGWIKIKGDSDGDKVLFFGGLRFHWRRILGGLKHDKPQRLVRSGGENSEYTIAKFTMGSDNGQYELTCESILESDALRPAAPPEGNNDQAHENDDDNDDW